MEKPQKGNQKKFCLSTDTVGRALMVRTTKTAECKLESRPSRLGLEAPDG